MGYTQTIHSNDHKVDIIEGCHMHSIGIENIIKKSVYLTTQPFMVSITIEVQCST